MVYCHKCGNQNPDEATFCNKCGAPMHAAAAPQWQAKRDDCDRGDDPCTGSKRGDAIFWGIIVILIGLWILFEFVLKNVFPDNPLIKDFEFWWLFGLIIGIAIIIAGVRLITRRGRA
ncbi:MAG: zinc-ribbon domain-containing protein [Thermoplasmata archaeon]|nr:zinc-ribbon domain-containing protein [Thermoplasmata archaeon]